jgi:fatty acid synthase
LKCVFVDDASAPAFSLGNPFYYQILSYGLAINVLRNGQWGSYKHLLLQKNVIEPARYVTHCYANSLVRSDLSSLKWLQGPLFYKANSNIVNVQYASVNFRDIMLATGKLAIDTCGNTRMDQQCVLGYEFSGITGNGKRVMGMVNGGALSTHIKTENALLWDVPKDWDLSDAATVPVVYATVYVAFFMNANIQKGKSILIHAGSGGVGLAAIHIAFAYGLEVYTTVSTEEKKNFLLKEFPQLKKENIGNSRDTSFEDMIMLRTNGKGVDYVLNSLAEEKLRSSIKCLGHGGKFLEIGKFDTSNNNKIGLRDFLREISFHAIYVDNMIKSDTQEKDVLRKMLQRDLDRGIIKPLKKTIFKASEIEQAYRFMASGKHTGKIILQLRENESDAMTIPIQVISRVYCNPEFTYIIPGGLGGFGLELADWLVLRGCKKLVLSSSRGITKQYQAYRIQIWESYGVKVAINTSNIATKEGCEQLIRDAIKLGPVGGIFNLAVLLRDSIFENQDETKFIESMGPKALATKYLDEISRVLCPELQYFVIFSSVSCGRGNAGQSNYGMSNSVMERIMEQRNKLGLPAKAIQWGAVGEVGLVADMQEDKLDLEIGGTLQQRISSCLEELDPLILSKYPIVSSMVVAEKRYIGDGSGNIIETIMNVMSIKDIKSVSMETTLSELGMDSLMTVEIQQLLERDFDVVISAQELRSMTLGQLQKCVKNKDSKDATGAKVKITNENIMTGKSFLLRNLGDEENCDDIILKLENNIDKGTKILIVPGIEGVAGQVWYNIAKSLNYPTYILQTLGTWDTYNIDEIFNSVIKSVLKMYERDPKFFIIGYSFGSLIALKIASTLEKLGKVGKIMFVDGSPLFISNLAKSIMPNQEVTDENMQNYVLSELIISYFDENVEMMLKEIYSTPKWEDKLRKFMEFSKENPKKIYSDEYIFKICNAVVNRLNLSTRIDVSSFSSLRSTRLKLIRPTDVSVHDIEEDYGLKKYAPNTINVLYVDGNHTSMLDNPKLCEFVNDF